MRLRRRLMWSPSSTWLLAAFAAAMSCCLHGVVLHSAAAAAVTLAAAAAASSSSASEAEDTELPTSLSGTRAVINITYIDAISNQWHTERGEHGRFLSPLVDGAHGVVIHGRNCTFCKSPLPLDDSAGAFAMHPWIALIQYGSCSLTTKLRLAWESNASAIVVYHPHDERFLQRLNPRMQSLVAVAIDEDKGMEIAELVDNGTIVHMYITVGSKSLRPNINRTSILFVSVSFIVLMIISLAWLIFYYVQRFRYIHAKEQLARRLCSAAKKALAKIPVKKIKEAEGEYEGCAVCLELYELSDVVRTLPCKHVFHRSCVDPWLLEHRTCPMCKLDILKYYGLMFTNSQDSILEVEEATLSSVGDRDSDARPSPAWQHQPPTFRDFETTEELETDCASSAMEQSLPQPEPSLHSQDDCSFHSEMCMERSYSNSTLHAIGQIQEIHADGAAKEEAAKFLTKNKSNEQFVE